MTSFATALAELVRLLPQIRELCTRQSAIQESIVTRNDDPTGMRRIKVTREAQGGQSESDWFPCGRSSSHTDEPIPPVGTHCLVALVNGDPHKPFFLRTLSNQTNPPDQGQLQPTKDNTTQIPGDDKQVIVGDRSTTIQGALTEEIGKDVTITCKGQTYHLDAEFGELLFTALATGVGTVTVQAADKIRFEQGGAYAEMTNGVWTFADADGSKWVLGGGAWSWDAAGKTIRIINAADMTISGKSIATIDAVDNRGDLIVSRGW